jgi:hypothetical protein
LCRPAVIDAALARPTGSRTDSTAVVPAGKSRLGGVASDPCELAGAGVDQTPASSPPIVVPLPVVVLLLQVGLLAHALEPANPQASAKARAILNYLEKLPRETNKRLVSGQFTSYGPHANGADCQDAFDKTGHWPAMIGLDYADFGKGGVETKTVNRVAMEYSRQGGLVTISTHLYNPANPRGGGLRDQGVVQRTSCVPVSTPKSGSCLTPARLTGEFWWDDCR